MSPRPCVQISSWRPNGTTPRSGGWVVALLVTHRWGGPLACPRCWKPRAREEMEGRDLWTWAILSVLAGFGRKCLCPACLLASSSWKGWVGWVSQVPGAWASGSRVPPCVGCTHGCELRGFQAPPGYVRASPGPEGTWGSSDKGPVTFQVGRWPLLVASPDTGTLLGLAGQAVTVHSWMSLR